MAENTNARRYPIVGALRIRYSVAQEDAKRLGKEHNKPFHIHKRISTTGVFYQAIERLHQ